MWTRIFHAKLLYLLSSYFLLVGTSPSVSTHHVSFYFSRPDLSPPKFKINFVDKSKVRPGYYFISPWKRGLVQNGPYIFDQDGELVWSGNNLAGAANSHGIHVCLFRGAPHLCFFEGEQLKTTAQGRGVIMDNSYRIVANLYSGHGRAPLDMHDFHITSNGQSALVTIFDRTPQDLSIYGISTQIGWVYDTGFQEIDIGSNKVVYDWRSLIHIQAHESLSPPIKTGRTRYDPWDYLHVNSVDKFMNGDYLVSGRHTSSIYRVSGTNGTILWRLGGFQSNFNLTNFEIGFQHHVRVHEESKDTTMVSLFNNGWDGRHDAVLNASYGGIIRLDHIHQSATLVRQYNSLYEGTLSKSQGSLNRIPHTNNYLVGWGDLPYVTEHLENGTMILNASLGGGLVTNYRAFKSNWRGVPLDTPALWTFAKSPRGNTFFYVSWNGATEVNSWNFYGISNFDNPHISKFHGCGDKVGFETVFESHEYTEYAYAEAVARNGTILARSTVVKTFVPGYALHRSCTNSHCPLEAQETELQPNRSTHVTLHDSYSSFIVRHYRVCGIFDILGRLFVTALGVYLLRSGVRIARKVISRGYGATKVSLYVRKSRLNHC